MKTARPARPTRTKGEGEGRRAVRRGQGKGEGKGEEILLAQGRRARLARPAGEAEGQRALARIDSSDRALPDGLPSGHGGAYRAPPRPCRGSATLGTNREPETAQIAR